MRVKTSVTLPADLIARLDLIDSNRSAVLERAARAFLALRECQFAGYQGNRNRRVECRCAEP
jgi:metal-responsive CopG/Arc/MetJ family transcriptional regulator